MIFSTYWFVVFAAIALPVYWAIYLPGARKWWLAACCIVFHGHFAGAAGVTPIIIMGLVTYLAGLSRQKWICHAAIALNVVALLFYKYTQFFALNAVGWLSPAAGDYLWASAKSVMPAAPPLAISFFAFEFVHYLYDVSHGEHRILNPLDFLLFAIFFPSLVAGPIKRFENFLPAMRQGLARVSANHVAEGLVRIGVGFFKKLCLADNMTLWITYMHGNFTDFGLGTRWLFFVALGLRIYMDFSGYSDIALGLARVLGITLPENFNWPYIATDIQDFWRRWHISLSSWIRDYVYIPLGGGRHGKARTVANGLIAFGLCGLWHGAAWNYAFWGIYHGVGLAVCRVYKDSWKARLEAALPVRIRRHRHYDRGYLALSWLITQFFVFVGWVFFFYPMEESFRIFRLLIFKH
jgi:alginate O-acetyltransferase complex protein AlgI